MKPHMSNPRARRLIRNGEARMRRAARKVPVLQSQRQEVTTSRGRCQVRDKHGHRCSVRGVHRTVSGHEIHRAFKREFVMEAGG